MAKKVVKKKAYDMTTEELAQRVFPKQVVEHLKRVAQESDDKPEPKSSPKQE